MKSAKSLKTVTNSAIGLLMMTGLHSASYAAISSSTATANLTVSATVSDVCTISTTPLAFGTVNTLSTTNGTGAINVTCTNNTPYNITLSAGTSHGATTTNRSMIGATSKMQLKYSIYLPGTTTSWGDSDAAAYKGTGNGSAQSISVTGSIPIQPSIVADTYSDVVVATVSYT